MPRPLQWCLYTMWLTNTIYIHTLHSYYSSALFQQLVLGSWGLDFIHLRINSVPTHAALLSLEMGVGVGVPEATQTSPEYGHLLSI